ncbi:hypothetical protein F7725_019641 [Dissostichus mawsoni]|uniref:Small ribosomal subunit protein uS10m n=1 Tax=Dissostichus mawsoni TaxID=36200 RepID=A0A7J5YKA4_DISMA|nr:hypothetical protein F7725_019641 [Dissostichus mawsoni]
MSDLPSTKPENLNKQWSAYLCCCCFFLCLQPLLYTGRARQLGHVTGTSLLPLAPSTSFHTATVLPSTPSPITVTEEPDALFQRVSVLVKGHDRAVLDSYEIFATMAANELGITQNKVYEPPKDMERLTLLKSIHIFKNHRVQYEMRTHYRCIELSHITGCTAQVYLEYIQRNLPEGVAMEVTKTAMEKVPDHIKEPMWEEQPVDDKPSQ